MWNCGVTIVVCVMIRVSSLPVPNFLLDFEDVDTDYTDYDYIDLWSNWRQYNQNDMEEFNDTDTYDDNALRLDNDTDLRWNGNSDWGQYNQTNMEEFNDTETYDDDALRLDNDTDLWWNGISDWGQYNQTDMEEFNQTEIVQNKVINGRNITRTLFVPPTTWRPTTTTRRPTTTTQRPTITAQRPPTTTRRRRRPQYLPLRYNYKRDSSFHYNRLLLKYKIVTGVTSDLVPHDDAVGRCPNNETCVKKCCPKGYGFDMLKNMCRADKFSSPVWKSYLPIEEFNVSKEFYILEGKIRCRPSLKEEEKLVTNKTRHYHLQSDGTLVMERYQAAGPELVFNTTKYCIDRFITAENKTEWNAFVCHVEQDFKKHFVLNGSCMLLTCFLVLLRVVVFAWLPELRTLHGMILMAYLVSFLAGFLLLGSKMLLIYEKNINRKACVVLTFIIHFCILSAFFWRNVMCHDIWWTFSSTSNVPCPLPLKFGNSLGYVGYLGSPADLFTSDSITQGNSKHSPLHCPLGNSKLLYFYGPIIILFVINMVLFTLTALKIAAIKKETEMILQSKESGTHDRKNDRRRFTLFIKLFAVMLFLEVNWIIEIVAIFYPEKEMILIITDLYNMIILFVIILNFLCQKRTWIVIKKRCSKMRGLPTCGQTAGGPTGRTAPSHTSQSQDDTLSTDCSQEKTNPTESQVNTITIDYSRERKNPAQSQDNTQSIDYSIEMSNLAQRQDDTITTDYSREKTNPALGQDDTQATDYSREKTNPAESQNDSIITDYSQEKQNPAAGQDDTQVTNYSQEKTKPADGTVDKYTVKHLHTNVPLSV